MISEANQLNAERDKVLVERFIMQGDAKAFDEIVMYYRDRLYVAVFNVVYNRPDAEEIVQDTFIAAHRCLKDFRGDSSLSTWLHIIATNRAVNRSNYNKRRGKYVTVSIDARIKDGEPATYADLIVSPEVDFRTQNVLDEFARGVLRCMQHLPPYHREILSLRIQKHLSYGQLAKHFGIGIGTVKSRIARARESLRELLQRREKV